VAFDVDDTVTRDGRLELVAFDAMHRLASAGLRLIAVTGRPLGWVDVIAQHWPVDLAIGENGAGWVWWDGSAIHEGYFDSKERRQAYPDLFERVRARVKQELPHVKPAMDQRARRCDMAFDIGETVHLPEVEVAALRSLIESEGARAAASSVHAHVIPGDWTKAEGIERGARDALGVNISDEESSWLFIGDSTNDWSAFDFFSLSVGVANVRHCLSRLKAQPKFVTSEDRGRGFAEMAKHVLMAR
jgi:HAD superfamily hydrolase (TIGR01484 family)